MPFPKAVVYYNPSCGTCQKVVAALKAKKVTVEKVEYLKTPPTTQQLDQILKTLGKEPWDIVRQKEPFYQEQLQGKIFSRSEWLKILHENPVLIERPIVVFGHRAIIARPAEVLETLFTTNEF